MKKIEAFEAVDCGFIFMACDESEVRKLEAEYQKLEQEIIWHKGQTIGYKDKLDIAIEGLEEITCKSVNCDIYDLKTISTKALFRIKDKDWKK